ncbi:hypothetical protein [Nocardioides zeae]|uniref:Uncharacterized protein n=1 Tax=Nocardioides zeae TaxID=1457234 RepID=A0A6P0HKH2_9ACTN|nr:hypothetical protein [Nocardioides zeae]NEN78145.1 hypothetical protein [Nocardioides zeae]
MHTAEERTQDGTDAVREYVALDRALRRLEAKDPGQSAVLRLQLNRARATYLKAGPQGEQTYTELLVVLHAACASALVEVEGGSGPTATDARPVNR